MGRFELEAWFRSAVCLLPLWLLERSLATGVLGFSLTVEFDSIGTSTPPKLLLGTGTSGMSSLEDAERCETLPLFDLDLTDDGTGDFEMLSR